jgi:phage minor structural protein
MRPILFNKNEQSFDTYGLGELNVTKGTVTRESNGNYTLYAEIPVNDPAVAGLDKEMKLKADAGLRTKNQTFEISRIVKDSSNLVKIYGRHISHKLEYMALRNATAFNGSAFSALAIWKGALIGDLRFDVWSDIQTVGKGVFDISKIENARLALGGVEGSILDIYGGEYEFDNMTVRLHKQLGRTAPTVLEYGRNILSAESDETIESSYTSVLPFATYTPDKPEGDTSDSQPDPITVTLPENYVDSKYKALYAHRRIKVVDFSSEFKSDSKNKDIPTADKLRKLATDYMERNAIGKPKINIKIEYADLAKTLDYADRAWIEELELCDIVPIYYPQIGLTDETAKVTTITYDFVNERNESVEFGDIGTNVRSTMQSGLAGKVDDIAKAQQDFENSLPDYLLNAQGNKVWYNKPDDKEHKVGDIWFEKNGIYDRMYVWNGEMWEKRIDTEDIDKVKKEFDKQLEQANQSTAIEIEKANAKANEALAKAGTIPDMPTLSEQIKAQVLNSAEFNHLTETNKLYERVIGESETDMPDKLSRLVMSSQIFQTEVGKYSTSGGPNLIRNSGYKEGLKYFSGTANRFRLGTHPFYFNGSKPIAIIFNDSTNEVLYQTNRFDLERNTDYVLNFRGFNNSALTSCEVFVLGRKKDETQNFTIIKHLLKPTKLSGQGVEDVSLTFNSGEIDNAYVRFDNNGSSGGQADLYIAEIDLYKGTNKRPWQPAPEDSAEPIEAVRTQMSLLAGSWAVKNLNSAGDVLNSINVLADGSNRIDGRLTHITGQTVIDEAVIDSANLKKVSASKISGGEADFAKMTVVNFDAKNVTSGTFTGLTFKGGLIESLDGSISINLANNTFAFNNNAMIEFRNKNNAIYRRRNTHTGFIHMADMNYKGVEGLYASIGVTSSGDGINSSSSGRFVGARFFRMAHGLQHQAVIDQAEFYGDAILFRDDFTIARGIDIRPDLLDKVYSINSMIADIKALWACWGHLNNVPEISHPNFATAVKNTMRERKIY